MLPVNARAPEFVLRDVDGNSHAFEASSAPLTLVIFFKTTCPTCHYAWRFYERLHTAFANAGLRVFGISQHDTERTRTYRDEYHATFPHLVDKEFAVSRAYDPAFVPTGFLIDAQATIVETFQSWNKTRLDQVSKRIARILQVPPQQIVTPQDKVVETKIG